MWAEALLNEEAAEPFLLLSNCMLVCRCEGAGESASWRDKVLLSDLIGALSRLRSPFSLFSLCPFKLGKPWRGHTMERRGCGNWAVVLLRGGWGRERTGSHS